MEVLSKTINQSGFQLLQDLLKDLSQKYGLKLMLAEYQIQQIRSQINYNLITLTEKPIASEVTPFTVASKQFLGTDANIFCT